MATIHECCTPHNDLQVDSIFTLGQLTIEQAVQQPNLSLNVFIYLFI